MGQQRVFLTGGAGYVGATLVPSLLANGHDVTVMDLMIYGDDVLPQHDRLRIVKGDIRDQKLLKEFIPTHDVVIHLACISNDPSFEINPELGKSINLDAFRPLVEISKDSGVDRFIYASSSSVYGIKESPNVVETMTLEPLTDYSKFKALCEDILLEYQSDKFTTTIVRPATVCGYSPRQRLDVVVNILTNLAHHKRKISVFGGDQLRPNIHIEDMANVYLMLIEADKNKIGGEIFNAGYENQTVKQIAETVKSVIGDDVELEVTPTDDNRSYHVSSEKIKKVLGFETKKTIADAVVELKQAFDEKKLHDPLNNEMYVNLRRMQSINLT